MSAGLPDLDALAASVLDRLPAGVDGHVVAAHVDQGLTRFANSHVHQNVSDRTTSVDLRVLVDGRAASSSTTRITEDGLAAVVQDAVDLARISPVDEDHPGFAPAHDVPSPRPHDAATRAATPADRAELVRAFIEVSGAGNAAGFCETVTLTAAHANTLGHRASATSTRATLDGIHRSGAVSGSGHQTSRSLADIDGAAVGRKAAHLLAASRKPIDLAPERLPIVLGPEATATVAVFLGLYGFNAKAVAEGRSFVRVGEEQFDPAFRLADDPTDPRACGTLVDAEGQARQRLVLVQDGRSVAVAHDRRTAAAAGTTSTGHHVPGSDTMGPIPTDLVVAGGDTPPADLVADIERGLLVTSFNYCHVLDPRTVVVTGLTRNGTFLVEDGEITHAVGNLRFTQSFVDAVGPGAVLGVGDDGRHANCEFAPGMVIAPSLHLASWNITGGAEG